MATPRCYACGAPLPIRPKTRSERVGWQKVELGTGRKIAAEQEKVARAYCNTCAQDHRSVNVMAL